MELMSISAEQIRSGRERLRMTQQQLADELGVSLRTVGNWERGETVPRNRLAPLAEVLRLTDPPAFGTDALLRRLGYLCKQRREEIGLARQGFAKAAGLGSDRTLVAFEFGRTLPSPINQQRLEKALSWRLGSIDDTMRMINRKAEDITMESLDAEDSLYLESQDPKGLAFYSDDDLIDELRRRMKTDRRVAARAWRREEASKDPQGLYGLAASTNSEHLEDDDEPTDS